MKEHGHHFHGKCISIVFHSTPGHIHSYATVLNSEFQIDDVTLLLTINIKEASDQEQLDTAMTLVIAGQHYITAYKNTIWGWEVGHL